MRTAILSIVDHVGQPDTHHPSTLAELQAVLDGTTNLVLTCDVLSPPDLAEDATVVDIRTLVRRSRIADQLIAVDELLMLVSESLANFESLTSWGIVWQENPLAALGRRRLGLRALTIISGGLGGGGAQAIAERLPATLTTLNLGGNEIGEGGARAIAERLPTTLTTLNLQGNWIGEGGARAIAEHLPTTLTTLNLDFTEIGEGGARAIAERLPATLTTLNLGGNGIGEGGARAIAEHLPTTLTTLNLDYSEIGEGGARAIAERLPATLTTLNLWGNWIGEGGARAIAEHLPTTLTTLNLDHNEIGEGGARAIAEHLPATLTTLNLGRNEIGEDGAREIAEHLPTTLTTLNLWGNRLGDEGARAIAENLPATLTTLNLWSNGIGEDGARAIAENLPATLTTLNLQGNEIGEDGARAIAGRLPATLTTLNLGRNEIGEDGAREIAEHLPAALTTLNLQGNEIGEDGAREIAENLPATLTTLNLGRNEIGEDGAREIAEHLPATLTTLNLGGNRLGDEGARAIAGRLPATLTTLNLGGNEVGEGGAREIAERLPATLTTLNLGGNEVGEGGAREIAERLPATLTTLNLGYNEIGDDGARAIAEKAAYGLAGIDLEGNEISDLRPFCDWLRLGSKTEVITRTIGSDLTIGRGLAIGANRLSNPPMEIVSQGTAAILAYYDDRERQGTSRLYEAKVLLIGEGRAGKTSLLRRLYRPGSDLPPEKGTTKGIDIHQHDFHLVDGETFRLNVWDFGGQEIYHATHQFFFTRRSLYVLLDDTSKDYKSVTDDGFKYWLEAVETLTDASPVIIFQNEKGGRSKKIDIRGIKGRFPNVLTVLGGDLNRPDAADELQTEIQHQVQRLPHVGEELPAKWVTIRAALQELAMQHSVIEERHYLELYASHVDDDPPGARRLSRYLHDLGVFLHFQDDELLRRIVVLRNEWATDAVFAIVDDEKVKAQRGLFGRTDCGRLWSGPDFAERHPELLRLMEQFELSYRLDNNTWLAPQLLSPERPTELDGWAQPSDLSLVFRYDFLPKGVVSRLIVRLNRYVQRRDLAWASGAMFDDDDTSVLVEIPNRGGQIELRARGPERKEILSTVAAELDGLNATYGDLAEAGRVRKEIPCTCTQCSQTTTPHRFGHRNLIRRRTAGQRTAQCEISYCEMDVHALLDGVNLGGALISEPNKVSWGDMGVDARRGEPFSYETSQRWPPTAPPLTINGSVGTLVTGSGPTTTGDNVASPHLEAAQPAVGLPDRLQVWAGAGLVVAAVLAVIAGLSRDWDFSTPNPWLTVGGIATIGAIIGTALAFLRHAIGHHFTEPR